MVKSANKRTRKFQKKGGVSQKALDKQRVVRSIKRNQATREEKRQTKAQSEAERNARQPKESTSGVAALPASVNVKEFQECEWLYGDKEEQPYVPPFELDPTLFSRPAATKPKKASKRSSTSTPSQGEVSAATTGPSLDDLFAALRSPASTPEQLSSTLKYLTHTFRERAIDISKSDTHTNTNEHFYMDFTRQLAAGFTRALVNRSSSQAQDMQEGGEGMDVTIPPPSLSAFTKMPKSGMWNDLQGALFAFLDTALDIIIYEIAKSGQKRKKNQYVNGANGAKNSKNTKGDKLTHETDNLQGTGDMFIQLCNVVCPLLLPFPHLAENWLRTLLEVVEHGASPPTQNKNNHRIVGGNSRIDVNSCSHVVIGVGMGVIERLVLSQRTQPFFHGALRAVVVVYRKVVNNWTQTSTSAPSEFLGSLRENIARLYRHEPQSAYQHAYVYCRMLANDVESAEKGEPGALDTVRSWPFVQRCMLWCTVVSVCSSTQTNVEKSCTMRPLISPLASIIERVTLLSPGVPSIPLRLLLAESAQRLAEVTKVYLPITWMVWGVLEVDSLYTAIRTQTLNGAGLPAESLLLQAKVTLQGSSTLTKVQLRDPDMAEAVLDKAIYILAKELDMYKNNPGFVELSIPIHTKLIEAAGKLSDTNVSPTPTTHQNGANSGGRAAGLRKKILRISGESSQKRTLEVERLRRNWAEHPWMVKSIHVL